MVTRKLKPNTPSGQPKQEILQVAEIVAQEKGISKEEVLDAMEHALLKISQLKYGQEQNLTASIDRKTGEIRILRLFYVVNDEVENPDIQMSLADARIHNPAVNVGDTLEDLLPPPEFGRIAAHSVRQVISQRVKDAERSRQYEEYKDRIGDVVNVLVKRVEFGNVIVDLGTAEGVVRRDNLIPKEVFRPNDRLKAIITELKPDAKGPMISLSRTHPGFMAKLFSQEVPEIYDGAIEIKAVARDPGSRAKMAVYTADSNIDPIGSCVGMRGSRVQGVVNELQGEKVDIIRWSSDVATFVVSAMAPASVQRVVIDEDEHSIAVVVPEDQQSLAIGRRGQNVRLASELTGWKLDIITEAKDQEQRAQQTKNSTELFMQALDIDDIFAQLLVAEGFQTVEEILTITENDFIGVDGIDADLIDELKNRAQTYLDTQVKETRDLCLKGGMEPELIAIDMPVCVLKSLLEKKIHTRDDLGDLSGDELQDLVGNKALDMATANAIIMKAREHWFA